MIIPLPIEHQDPFLGLLAFSKNKLTGAEPNDRAFSKQLIGKQINPAIAAIVHGVGHNAMSFPPMETMRTSSDEILSRINRSCGRKWSHRSLRVVASTAVLIAAYRLLTYSLQSPLGTPPPPIPTPPEAHRSPSSSSSSTKNELSQYVTSHTLTGGSNTCPYTPATAGRRFRNQYLLSSEESPAVQMRASELARRRG